MRGGGNTLRTVFAPRRGLRGVGMAVAALSLLLGVRCDAQSPGASGQNSQPVQHVPYGTFPDEGGPSTGGGPVFMQRRLRQLNAAQHEAMVADTRKLVKLVTELNAEIANSNAQKLTPEQMRTVAEIEKLAHSVRDKMRISVRGTTDPMDTPTPSPFGPR